MLQTACMSKVLHSSVNRFLKYSTVTYNPIPQSSFCQQFKQRAPGLKDKLNIIVTNDEEWKSKIQSFQGNRRLDKFCSVYKTSLFQPFPDIWLREAASSLVIHDNLRNLAFTQINFLRNFCQFLADKEAGSGQLKPKLFETVPSILCRPLQEDFKSNSSSTEDFDIKEASVLFLVFCDEIMADLKLPQSCKGTEMCSEMNIAIVKDNKTLGSHKFNVKDTEDNEVLKLVIKETEASEIEEFSSEKAFAKEVSEIEEFSSEKAVAKEASGIEEFISEKSIAKGVLEFSVKDFDAEDPPEERIMPEFNVRDIGTNEIHESIVQDSAVKTSLEFSPKGHEANSNGDELSHMDVDVVDEAPQEMNDEGPHARSADTGPILFQSCQNDGGAEMAVSSELVRRHDVGRQIFEAKIASNQTVLPADLLLKVADFAATYGIGSKDDASPSVTEMPKEIGEAVPGLEDDIGTLFLDKLFDERANETWKGKKADRSQAPQKKPYNRNENRSTKPARLAPTHFVAIQVTNPEIHSKIAEIQKTIITHKSVLKDAMVNLPTLHLTLMVLHLKDVAGMDRAKAALDSCKQKILDSVCCDDSLNLPFAGIGDFNDKVVFAKVRDGPELNRLKTVADLVSDSFAQQELFSTDNGSSFEAHLTIMKLSKSPWLYRKRIKKIDPGYYADHKDEFFGWQPLLGLQLCAMKKSDDGYYVIDHEVLLDSENLSKNEGVDAKTSDTENSV